ncbi:MAG: dipicolinate synthase subunit B, partial [Clostridia bacterium]|nr:dipicolinate synthase subunit B [Clostridia bacterium]
LRELIKTEQDILPIMSEAVYSTDTRFWRADIFREEVEKLCSRTAVHTIKDAEPLGPKTVLDALIIAPCTGNTLAKLANGITDTAVTMAAKAHLRSDRPLLIALASNDALSANLKNIATLLQRKSVFFVPLKQDDPQNKPHSLVCDFSLLQQSYEKMKVGRQSVPLFL